MSQKIMIDNLGRVKSAHFKGDSSRALLSLINALKPAARAPSQVPTATKTMFREAISYIASDKNISKYFKKPLMYNPGKEKEVLDACLEAYALLEGVQGLETKEQSRERKANIDKFYSIGVRLLYAKKVSEANMAFQEAIKYFRDEKKLFIMIGNKLCEVGEHVRAMDYLKKANGVDPESKEVQALALRIKEKS